MWPDITGDWGTLTDNTDPNGFQVNPDPLGLTLDNNVTATTAAPAVSGTTGSSTGDWTGFFQNLAGNVTNYAIAKDARQSGVMPIANGNGQITYASTAKPVSSGVLLLVVAGAALLLAHKG